MLRSELNSSDSVLDENHIDLEFGNNSQLSFRPSILDDNIDEIVVESADKPGSKPNQYGAFNANEANSVNLFQAERTKEDAHNYENKAFENSSTSAS